MLQETRQSLFEVKKLAVLREHRLAIIDFYAQAFGESLEYTKRIYENGRLDEFLDNIRVCLAPPLEQDLETQRILGNGAIPIVMVAPPSYFKQHGFRPTIQAATSTNSNARDCIWIRNGENPLFSGRVTSQDSEKFTLHLTDDFGHEHKYTASAQHEVAIKFYRQEAYMDGYDDALPQEIGVEKNLSQFIRPDGSLMKKTEIEAYYSAKQSRTLDLSYQNFFKLFTRELHHAHRVDLMEAAQNPSEFLRLVDMHMRRLRRDWNILRGKIETNSEPFQIIVNETEKYWNLHIHSIDISEWPLPAISHPTSPNNIGDIVIRIGKQLNNNEVTFSIWVEESDSPNVAFPDYKPEDIIGPEQIITLLSVMEPDIEPYRRPPQPAKSHPKKRR